VKPPRKVMVLSAKYEEVFLKDYGNVFEARDSLGEYLTFYNEERRHSRLGGKTPEQVYWAGRESVVVAV
jgi:putative transposase